MKVLGSFGYMLLKVIGISRVGRYIEGKINDLAKYSR